MPLKRTLLMKKVVGRLTFCALIAAVSIGFGGCELAEKTRTEIDRQGAEARTSLDNAQNIRTTSFDPLKVTNKVWGGNASLRMQRGMPLPSRYETNRGVTLVSSEPMSLEEVANAVSSQTGIPVRMSALSIPGRSAAASSSSSSSSSSSKGGMPVSYEGPLSGLMDRIGAYFGVSWRFDGSSIAISRYETRIFAVEVMPGTHQINEGMEDDETSSSSSGSSSGGGSSTKAITQNSKVTMDLKYWDELTAVLNSIVGTQGSVVVSPTMGTITVTTTPEVMSTVADYISKENKRQARQIAINVTIYSVNLSESEDFSTAFTAFLRKYAGIGGIDPITGGAMPAITSPSVIASDMGSLNLAIIDGHRMGARDVFSALSAIGDTTTVASFPMTTLNNRPVSRRIGTDTTYISEVTQNTTSSSSTTTIATPTTSVVHDGFSLQITPRILDDGRILLQYSLSLIALQTMDTAGTGTDYTISLPVTDNRIFIQQSMLRSGQTLMIGGVDQKKLAQNKQGIGVPDNIFLGGGQSTYDSHVMMFISITPKVMDMGLEERN